MAKRERESGWAALIAGRMPRAGSERVRANRRLRQSGAIGVRPGVYALPDSRAGRESLAGAVRELVRGRGAAWACVLEWLDPADDAKLRDRYGRERERRQRRIVAHIERLERTLAPGSRAGDGARRTAHARLARLRGHLERAGAPGTPDVPDPRARRKVAGAVASASAGSVAYRGRTWVTRRGVLVDRIGSAWLIRRFIDRAARFRFVAPNAPPVAGELRFDMAEADFTHEDDRCTFEALARRFRPDDPALAQLAEIVHDLDFRDGKFGRTEAAGVARVIAGLAAAEPDDTARLDQGQWLFDCLYASLGRGPAPQVPKGVVP